MIVIKGMTDHPTRAGSMDQEQKMLSGMQAKHRAAGTSVGTRGSTTDNCYGKELDARAWTPSLDTEPNERVVFIAVSNQGYFCFARSSTRGGFRNLPVPRWSTTPNNANDGDSRCAAWASNEVSQWFLSLGIFYQTSLREQSFMKPPFQSPDVLGWD
ncbi:hypothetical protein BGZ60DRAFT_425139 [Tricladium varicosporioides]|nr:hypothetical protein BGZ60DRAFT_425139 [Hymenoscyphus varicosporioides]